MINQKDIHRLKSKGGLFNNKPPFFSQFKENFGEFHFILISNFCLN